MTSKLSLVTIKWERKWGCDNEMGEYKLEEEKRKKRRMLKDKRKEWREYEAQIEIKHEKKKEKREWERKEKVY